MWGKPDRIDRVCQALVLICALFALGNGAFMLIDPVAWYEWVGTVKATGPANSHFIRDIGLAYLFSGVLLAYGGSNLPMRWAAALAGAGWITFHAALHVWEVARGLCAPGIFWTEAPGTLGPPLLALIGIAVQAARVRILPWPMPSSTFLSAYNRMTYHLSPHLADFAAAQGHLAEKLAHFMPLNTHGHDASQQMLAMARFGAVQAEDCGPCLEITARAALNTGISRHDVETALKSQLGPGGLHDAWAFGHAITANTPDVADLGDKIEEQYGRTVRTELTIAAATARIHPGFKRGLGFARSCSVHPLKL